MVILFFVIFAQIVFWSGFAVGYIHNRQACRRAAQQQTREAVKQILANVDHEAPPMFETATEKFVAEHAARVEQRMRFDAHKRGDIQ